MADDRWEDEERAPRRRGVPSWVWWGCGAGCLLVVLVVGVLAVFAVRTVREATDPEKQWPKLGEVLAFEERPADLELEVGFGIAGMSQFYLVDAARGLRGTLMVFPRAAAEQLEKYLSAEGGLVFDFGRPVEPEELSLTVQGREVRGLRFARIEPEPEGVGAGIRVDLTGSGAPRALELRRMGSGAVGEEDVAAFLAPFDVWRAR